MLPNLWVSKEDFIALFRTFIGRVNLFTVILALVKGTLAFISLKR